MRDKIKLAQELLEQSELLKALGYPYRNADSLHLDGLGRLNNDIIDIIKANLNDNIKIIAKGLVEQAKKTLQEAVDENINQTS